MSDVYIGVKPMLFAGDDFYPNGGWDDFQGFFDTVDDAKKEILSWPSDKWIGGGWAHVVYESKIVLKASRHCYFNDISPWGFQENEQ